ncbi:MAG TPA: class I SAM-dependent methyltransferase [Patescibacteria group bacterium]|nr:class I SAM-dependent methyltransferase [Patescibacteria group bacterium]
MDNKAFELLDVMEGTWWYKGRMRAVTAATAALPSGNAVLDFGAGLGGMKDFLSKLGKQVYAFEPSSSGEQKLKLRGYTEVFSSLKAALQIKYDYICLFDVLEHIEDDKGFLKILREEAPESTVVLTVPAFMFLWGEHDVKHQHFRRYTKKSITKLFHEQGYTVMYARYWNVAMFPVAALLRLIGKTGESSTRLPKFLDTLLYGIVFVDTWLNKYVNLPFGVSLVCVAIPKK